jgi:hypothetical protein
MRRAVKVLLGLLTVTATSAALAGGDGVRSATYGAPSTSYGHDALGPGYEWAMLALHGEAGSLFHQEPGGLVFEDIAPRLADLDGDDDNEVIVVESDPDRGSRLAIWGGLGRIAATPFIGRRHRWLAPVGAADLDGDGRVEIAYVETPHLGKRLKIVRLEGDRLVPVAEAAGLTNHRLGEPFIQGRIADCIGQPTILTANADWTRIIATTLAGGELTSRDVGPYRLPDDFDAVAGCD